VVLCVDRRLHGELCLADLDAAPRRHVASQFILLTIATLSPIWVADPPQRTFAADRGAGSSPCRTPSSLACGLFVGYSIKQLAGRE
jgi:hypothetical protein